jgi:hypothetical protein
MYDYFVSQLQCPRCHVVHAAGATSVKTHLREDADGTQLGVGYVFDPADLRSDRIVDSSYLLVSAPIAADSPRLLDTWNCPACKTSQWALIEISQGRLSTIKAVPMNAATFKEANFISEVDGELLAAALLDVPPWELTERKLDPIEVLRQRLT